MNYEKYFPADKVQNFKQGEYANVNLDTGEVLFAGFVDDKQKIIVPLGTTINDWHLFLALNTVGVPSDNFVADNFFSGAATHASELNNTEWRVDAYSLHSNIGGSNGIQRHPIKSSFLLIQK